MTTSINNATILRGLHLKLQDGNFSDGANLSFLERLMNWIVNTLSFDNKAHGTTHLSDTDAAKSAEKDLARKIMGASVNENGDLNGTIEFSIGGIDFMISQEQQKDGKKILCCTNLSRTPAFKTRMGDWTISQLKATFFQDYLDKYCVNEEGQKTITSASLAGLDLSQYSFRDIEINAQQFNLIAQAGGDLHGAKLAEGCNLENMEHQTIREANIDRSMALEMIKAHAHRPSVIVAYTNSEVMKNNFHIDVSKFGVSVNDANQAFTKGISESGDDCSYAGEIVFTSDEENLGTETINIDHCDESHYCASGVKFGDQIKMPRYEFRSSQFFRLAKHIDQIHNEGRVSGKIHAKNIVFDGSQIRLKENAAQLDDVERHWQFDGAEDISRQEDLYNFFMLMMDACFGKSDDFDGTKEVQRKAKVPEFVATLKNSHPILHDESQDKLHDELTDFLLKPIPEILLHGSMKSFTRRLSDFIPAPIQT